MDIIKFCAFLFVASMVVLWFMNLGENKGRERVKETVSNAFHTTWTIVMIIGIIAAVGLAITLVLRMFGFEPSGE